MAPRDRPVAVSPSAMRKRGARKRLKFRANDVCLERVTVADYANSDPAVVKSGRVKKAVANAVQQEVKSLCGLEASCVPSDEILSVAEFCGSSDEMDSKDVTNDIILSRKKKSKRHKENSDGVIGKEYPIDIWLLLASYIRPEDTVNFSLICKRAWIVTCTAAFWTRLYRRHYNKNASLPVRLQPESIEKMYCLRACVIRSLYHMYKPFVSRVARNPAIPETTPSTLENSKCLLFWSKKVDRQSSLWEFSFKFQRQITTLNFIYVPIVMGMTVSLFTINVSTDMRHHRVKMVFHDSPLWSGKKTRFDHGVQLVMDPVHGVRLFDWWHPQFLSSYI
ncbi:transmembrane protein 183A isoform X2 [Rhineura floridana]|uniref:transmembrane protein 183A isoform X2 n=1 Tax=Rhineura floridana TaxID=261503 RepID=UPI002AC849AA|nr:transmembrane protein 183A isoform X2 [Rhineura floridana]